MMTTETPTVEQTSTLDLMKQQVELTNVLHERIQELQSELATAKQYVNGAVQIGFILINTTSGKMVNTKLYRDKQQAEKGLMGVLRTSDHKHLMIVPVHRPVLNNGAAWV